MSGKKIPVAKHMAKKDAGGTLLLPAGTGRALLLRMLLIFLAVFLVYFNGLHNKFNLDDELYHDHATELAGQGSGGILKAFTTLTFIEGDNAYEYRPLTLASFVAQYQLLGSAPGISHFINLLLYVCTCVLLFVLLYNWFGPEKREFAFFISLLFALHPLHTEIVDSIKNRDELFAFFFAVLAYIMAWKAYAVSRRNLLYILLAALCFFLAVISKKTIWPFFVIVPLAYYFFSKLSLQKILLYSLLFCSSIMLYRLYNILHLHANRPFFEYENPFYASSTGIIARAATAFYIMGRYLLLHVFPYRLAYYYGANYVPVVTWSDPLAIGSLLFYGFIAFLVLRYFKKKSIIIFGLIIYSYSIVMYSNLFAPAPGLMAERYTYMSSLGFCIVLCALLAWLFSRPYFTKLSLPGSVRFFSISAILIAAFYAVRTHARNNDWYDKQTLYTHDMTYLGSSAKANSMYAEILVAQARAYRNLSHQIPGDANSASVYRDSASYLLSRAKEHFKAALSISPYFPNALNNLGIIYIDEDSLGLAKQYMQRSLITTTAKARTYHDIAMLSMKTGDYDSASYYFNRSLAADSAYLNAYCDLSKLMIIQGDTANAEKALLIAAEKNNNSSIPYIQLADVASFKRDTQSIVRYCRIAAELQPPNIPILSFLIQYYTSKGDLKSATYYQEKRALISN